MDEADRTVAEDTVATVGGPSDRLARDGMAGAGDMLGGPNAGAGDRLGPEAGDQLEERPSPNQHSMAGAEFATDAARNYHGRDAPA
jgi:hypothetical protein